MTCLPCRIESEHPFDGDIWTGKYKYEGYVKETTIPIYKLLINSLGEKLEVCVWVHN